MPRRTLPLTIALLAALVATGCGDSGSSGTGGGAAPTTGGSGESQAGGQACAPVAGDELTVLDDDMQLQTVDNLIPAVSEAASTPELLDALNAVSEVLDTDTLIELNGRVDVQREDAVDVAQEFVESAGITDGLTQGSGSISVGAAPFTESTIMANIYADTLNGAGFDASVQTVGNRELYLPALQAGDEIQVFPEYVGTLTEFLNQQENGSDADPLASGDLDATVEALTPLGESSGLVFGDPSPAADQNAFAVTTAFADQYGVTSLTELAEACSSGLVLGGPPECPERPFCQPGLEDTYGLSFDSFVSLDAGGPLTKSGLTGGDISLGLVFSSDGSLAPSS